MSDYSPLYSSPQQAKVLPAAQVVPASQAKQQVSEQTNPPLAEVVLKLTQALDLSAKDLTARWEMNELMRRGMEQASARLQIDLEQLKRQVADLAEQTSENDKKLAESEANLSAARKEKEEAIKLKTEVDCIAAMNKKDEDRIKPLLEKEQEIIEKEKAAREGFQNAENERKVATAAKEAADEALKQAQTIKDQILILQSQSWPQCLSDTRWNEWRANLQESAKQDANAALVLAAFHRFCAAEKAADSQEISSALQDLGGRLYRFTDDVERIAQIGATLNEAANGRFQLKFARPGEPTADQWMNYQPGIGSVRQVRNWAVYKPGPSGGLQIASKADVQ
jgi:chromosome segregation ATPase